MFTCGAWPRYCRPDSTGLDHALMVAWAWPRYWRPDSTGLDHALMVACGLTQILAAWFYRPGLTQILAAWFYRSWSRIGGCLAWHRYWRPDSTGLDHALVVAWAWPRYWRPDSTGLDHALVVACGLTQILAAWFYRSWSRIGGCLGLTQILAAWFYRSWSRIGGCLWLDPDTGGLIPQVLITHWWLPVAWPRYWRPDSTGLDHALMVACGLTQILAAWFYRPGLTQILAAWFYRPGLTQIMAAWFYRPGLTQILAAWFYRPGLTQILAAWFYRPGLTQIMAAWFYRPGLTQIMAAWFYRSSPRIDGCLWLDPDTGGLILQAWLDPDAGSLIIQVFTTHWWLPVAWPRYWRPDSTGLDHAFMVACGVTQILAAWFYRPGLTQILAAWLYRSSPRIDGCLWLDPDTGGLIIQVFTTHWWLPVAWPRYWRPDYTGLDHALMVACGLTQILAAWFYRSWSRIDGCLWLDPDTGGLILQVLITHWWLPGLDPDTSGLILQVLITHWWLPVAWPRYWQPDSTGLDHALMVAWLDPDTGGLILQVLITHWWLPVAWHRYWQPDSTGLDHALVVAWAWPRYWRPDSTGLDHALVVACGLTQILAAWFYRSWSRIDGCLWLDPDTGSLILQVLITQWWLPVAWPRYWQPDSTGLDHAMMVTCGLTQILAAWFYRSWSRIDGCLAWPRYWRPDSTGLAWPRYWRPDSTGLDQAFVVACGLTQILVAWFYRSWSRIGGCLAWPRYWRPDSTGLAWPR